MFNGGALGNYSLAGFEMVIFIAVAHHHLLKSQNASCNHNKICLSVKRKVKISKNKNFDWRPSLCTLLNIYMIVSVRHSLCMLKWLWNGQSCPSSFNTSLLSQAWVLCIIIIAARSRYPDKDLRCVNFHHGRLISNIYCPSLCSNIN